MKTILTPEQSNKLFELGIPKECASEIAHVPGEDHGKLLENGDMQIHWVPNRVFTTNDLLKILPTEIQNQPIVITHHNDDILEYPCWNAYYLGITNSHLCEELIDSLYELTIWYLQNKGRLE